MQKQKNYGEVLIDFIEPICNENESEEALFAKLQLGRIAWNYCIAQEHDLRQKMFEEEAKQACEGGANLKTAFDQLVARKMGAYPNHTDLILSVRIKHEPNDTVLDLETVKLEEVGRKEYGIGNR